MVRPPDLKELEDEIERLNVAKEEAVANQDFEKAAGLRDQADKLKKKKESLTREWRDKARETDGVVDADVIADVVSRMTGVPLTRLSSEDAVRLLQMEDELHKRIVSQNEAIKQIAKAVRRSRSGLKDPKRPTGVFLLSGPTGVGKTLLGEDARRIHVRRRRGPRADRHERVHGEAQRQPPDRRSAGLRRLRRGGPAHGEDPPPAVLGRAARRNRKGASRRLQHAPADHGRGAPHRQLRPQGRLPQRGPDHDDQRGGRRHQPGRRLRLRQAGRRDELREDEGAAQARDRAGVQARVHRAVSTRSSSSASSLATT